MRSVHYLLEVIGLYLICFYMLNLPQKRKIRLLSIAIFFMLAFFDVQRFIYLDGQLLEHHYDIYIYTALAILTLTYSVATFKLLLVVILAHLFKSFLITIIAGIAVIVLPMTINTIITNPVHTNIIRILTLFLILTLVKAMRHFKLRIDGASFNWRQMVLITAGLTTFGFYVGLIQQFVPDNGFLGAQIASFMATISGFVVVCIIVSLVVKDNQLKKVENLRYLQEELAHKQKRYYRMILKQEEETKKFRHDTANHFIIIQSLAKKGNYEDLDDYVSRLSKSLIDIKNHLGVSTGLDEVSAILLDLRSRYKKENIEVQWKGILPTNTKIPNVDMAILFMNLLENAFRAASQVEGDRLINVEIKDMARGIYLSVENNYSGKLSINDGKIQTQKSDKENHGYGLKILQDVIDTYQGEKTVTYTDDIFKVEIVFVW